MRYFALNTSTGAVVQVTTETVFPFCLIKRIEN